MCTVQNRHALVVGTLHYTEALCDFCSVEGGIFFVL